MRQQEQPRRERIASSGYRNNGNTGFTGNTQPRKDPSVEFANLNYRSEWIANGATPEMIVFAEKAGKYMAPWGETNKKLDKQCLSKSQIRNVYGEIKRIQFKGIESDEGKTSFLLLKPKVAYAEGRNRTKGLTLFKLIFDEMWSEVNKSPNKKTYDNFCALLEAILAYHKANGGQD